MHLRTTLLALTLGSIAMIGCDDDSLETPADDTTDVEQDTTVDDAMSDTENAGDTSLTDDADVAITDTANDTTAGPDTTEDTTAEQDTFVAPDTAVDGVPNGYPELTGDINIAVAASIDGVPREFSATRALGRGYSTVYGMQLDEVGGSGGFDLLGIPLVAPGVYDQWSMSMGLDVDGFDGISPLCDETDARPVLTVVGEFDDLVWGTIGGMVCDVGKRSLSGTLFTARVEAVEPDAGFCAGFSSCDTNAASSFSCHKGPGCEFEKESCVGSNNCAGLWFSESSCNDKSGCTFFDKQCGGSVVIPCDDYTVQTACNAMNGCNWIAQ